MSKLILIITLLVLIIGLPVGLYLVSKQTTLFSRASASVEPKQIQITNLTDNSFTVSFLTTTEVHSFIQYGTSRNLGSTAVDDRDQSGPAQRPTHHITLKNLDPETVIYYKISSGGKIFDKSGKPFEQRTALVVKDTPPLPTPVFGKIINEDKSISREALVYLKLKNGNKLSSFVRSKGNWLITLNNARSEDLGSYISPKAGDIMEISIQSANTKATRTEKYSGENKPLPDISLAQNK